MCVKSLPELPALAMIVMPSPTMKRNAQKSRRRARDSKTTPMVNEIKQPGIDLRRRE
jgi:hypothetical protein